MLHHALTLPLTSTHHAHGGTDAQGTALHDFSTNSNALGPCPAAAQRVQACRVDAYPDPSYHHLR